MTIRVFVSGQSNSLGRNTGGPDWSTISSDVRVWNNVNPLGANGTAFTTAALARTGGTFENTDRNNFAVWFCDRLADESGDTVDMTIVSRGATAISGWAPGNPVGMLQECIDVWTATGQAPANIFLWHQGEGNVSDDLATYGAAFNDLLTNLTTAGVIDSDTIVILGGLSQTGDEDKIVFNEEVLRPLAYSLPNGAFADSSRLPTDDGTHFTGDALYWFGHTQYYSAYVLAARDDFFTLVNEGGTVGVGGSGTNKVLNMFPILEGVSLANTSLQYGDAISWDWLQSVPANLTLWSAISPADAGLNSTNTNITNWDTTFNLTARFLGYSTGSGSGTPVDSSGVGVLIPRATNQAAQLFIQTSSTVRRAWFRGGGGAVWGPWNEFWHDGNFTPSSKADASVTVNLTGNQSITGVKTFQHTGAYPLVIERTNSANNSAIEYKGTGGSLWAGLGTPTSWCVGGAADLTDAANRWLLVTSSAVSHGQDNVSSSGASSRRWSVVYAATGTINTSDAREKTHVVALTQDELAASSALAKEVGTYKWLSSIEQKGEDARLHIGMTVQRAIEIMESHGLDPFHYGFICYDEWDELPEIVDPETGDLQQEYRPAGSRYSFRPDELLMFIARGQEERLAKLEALLT